MARREIRLPAARPIACAYEPCQRPAIARLQGPTGLANVCPEHYLFLAQREADLYCDSEGLASVAAMRAFCKKRISRFGRRSFEEWAHTITQTTVALLIRCGGNERVLSRLQDLGILDEDFRVRA